MTHDEGDSGTTIYTFVVERTNGTAGDVNFTGTFLRNTTLATDYPGNALPATAFSGIIPDGEASTTITITIAADTV
ncbi:MAG: hypothetical protein J0H62_12430, partial [Rhizobiales bacterium]|nr:hypothetical protein [Hyphomicrobiales bacterium]